MRQWFVPTVRAHWRRRTVALWLLALTLAVIYCALRWGGSSPPHNVLPSAD